MSELEFQKNFKDSNNPDLVNFYWQIRSLINMYELENPDLFYNFSPDLSTEWVLRCVKKNIIHYIIPSKIINYKRVWSDVFEFCQQNNELEFYNELIELKGEYKFKGITACKLFNKVIYTKNFNIDLYKNNFDILFRS